MSNKTRKKNVKTEVGHADEAILPLSLSLSLYLWVSVHAVCMLCGIPAHCFQYRYYYGLYMLTDTAVERSWRMLTDVCLA